MRSLFRAISSKALVLVTVGCMSVADPKPPEIENFTAGPGDRGHFPLGYNYDYGTPFPVLGPHSPEPAKPGFYEQPQPLVELVHALEHGIIVIYYDEPGEEAMSELHRLTELYRGGADGVIAVPFKGLGVGIVLTAWEHRLTLSHFDQARVADFLEKFRGRGPEHPAGG